MNTTHWPASPPQLRQACTEDFDDQATLLRGWNQHYDQLSPGTFRGAIIELLFDDIHLFIESTSHALYQSGKVADDAVAIGIPLRASGQGLFCGMSLAGGVAPVFSGMDGFEFYSPDHLMMGGVVVSLRALTEWFPEQSLAEIDGKAHLKEVSPTTLREAGRFLHTILDLCRLSPELTQSEALLQQIRRSVHFCVMDILGDGAEQTLSRDRRYGIVKKAREYLNDNSDEPVTVEGLCQLLHVSRRTLQYCFQDVLGMKPAAFLRARRLNQARHLLKEVDSVTEAAVAWGFWHFGHFSQEYKKLFGELPSDTLRRYHGATSPY